MLWRLLVGVNIEHVVVAVVVVVVAVVTLVATVVTESEVVDLDAPFKPVTAAPPG